MKNRIAVAIAVLVCVAVAVPAGAQQRITPPPPVLVTSPRVTINNGPGDQTQPQVSGDLASYTDATGASSVRYYRFSTGADQAIPILAGASDALSDISGNKIVFTRALAGCGSIMVFDAASAVTTEVAPTRCPQRFGASIGSSTVAYVDYTSGIGVIFAANLLGGAPTQLSSGTGTSQNPEVSASGDTVVWEQCPSLVNCNVMSSTRSGGVWGTATLVAQASSNPDSDGTNIVYDSNRVGSTTGRDIYLQPVGGGVETQLQISGEQSNPSLSSGVIAFESRAVAGSPSDIFVYVIATNMLYQVTSTPAVDDRLTNVGVLPNGDVRVVWASNDGLLGDYNVYATTFSVPLSNQPLTITANNATQVYGAATPTFGVTPSGFVNGDTLASLGGTLLCTTTASPVSPVGTYPITCSGLTSTTYAITYAPGTLTVTPATLTIAANNAARPYGAMNPVLIGTIAGLRNGDPITASFTTTAGPASFVGSYPILASAVDLSGKLGNYTLLLVNGTLTVVQERTSLTVTLSPLSIIVGQTSLATVTLTAPDMVIPIDPSVLAPITLSSPVVSDILTNNGVCTPVPTAAPGVATCVFSVTSVEPNGRTLLASFPGTTNLGSSTGSKELMVTAALESQKSCLNSDFRNVAVPGGSYLWFNSIFKVKDVTKHKITITFFQSNVQFQYKDASNHVVTVNQAMPDAKIVIDPSVTTASTMFDAVDNVWITTVPFDLDDATFLTGIPWLVPAGGIPGDIEPVTWCGTFASDTAGVDIGWRWAAAAYSSFSGDNSVLGVKPMFTDHDNPGSNRDLAGTPENFKQFVIPGARGRGGKNYTGSYSRSALIE